MKHKVQISPDQPTLIRLLSTMYPIPPDTTISGAGTNKRGDPILILEHPSFPLCHPGEKPSVLHKLTPYA